MAGRDEVDCPRAKTWMTPCIARDGHTALSYPRLDCIGCGTRPRQLLLDLSERHKPARLYRQTKDPKTCADTLARMVAEYVDGKDQES